MANVTKCPKTNEWCFKPKCGTTSAICHPEIVSPPLPANTEDEKGVDQKEPRLIRWSNDGYPPIDLQNEFKAVMELIKAYKSQQQELSSLRKAMQAADEVIEAYKKYYDSGETIVEHELLKAALDNYNKLKEKI